MYTIAPRVLLLLTFSKVRVCMYSYPTMPKYRSIYVSIYDTS